MIKAAKPAQRRAGRPPYSPAQKKQARRELNRALKILGWGCGWRTLKGHLPSIPTWLLQRMLSQLKLEFRRRRRKHRERHRTSVIILAREAMLAQDSTHTGRVRGRGACAEVTKDAATTKGKAYGDGKAWTAKDVVVRLKRLKASGHLPLVWSTDNAPIYTAKVVKDFLAKNRVIHFLSRPHTPQDNGRVEQLIGESKTDAGLGRGRRMRGILPHWRGKVSRAAFYKAATAAIRRATAGLKGREARTAQRKAILKALTRFKLALSSGPRSGP
jgi:transposase InsO family protein